MSPARTGEQSKSFQLHKSSGVLALILCREKQPVTTDGLISILVVRLSDHVQLQEGMACS